MLVASILGACDGSKPVLGGSDPNAKSVPDESGKTSDDSEGVPGYLVDPSMVGVQNNKIKGKDGAVDAQRGERSRLAVNVWQVDADMFAKARVKAVRTIAMEGKLLGSASVTNLGAFDFDLPELGDADVVVLTIAQAGNPARLEVPGQRDGHYASAYFYASAAEGPFAGLSALPEGLLNFDLGLLKNVPLGAQYQMMNCLGALYGKQIDMDKIGPYRRLGVSALISAGQAFDDPPSSQPELVHLVINGLRVANLDVLLKNKNATYCLDVHALSITNSKITVDCNAKIWDGRSAVTKSRVRVEKTGGC